MKTKTSTKLMLGVAGALLAIGSLQAQTTPGGKLWGYAFGDYAYTMHGDSANRGNGIQYKGLGTSASPTQGQNAVEFRRVYLGYDYTINDKFSATTLLAYEGDYDVNNNRTVYLKNIYVTWKNIFKNSNLIIGQQPTSSFATAGNTEPLWGYRSVEKTLLDMRKIDGSADMGISLSGHLWTQDTSKTSTFIGYNIMMGDNSGNTPVPVFTNAGTAQNSSTDKDKKFRFNVYGSLMQNKLTIGIYSDVINYGNFYFGTAKAVPVNTMTLKFYAAYNDKMFGIGFEYFQQTTANDEVRTDASVSPTKTDTINLVQSGMSIFAHVTLVTDKLNLFARYDMYNPDANYTNNNGKDKYAYLAVSPQYTLPTPQPKNTYTESFITAGLDWTPTTDKKVHIMPNLWYDGISERNGKNANDSYMIARLTFYYIFK